MTAFTRTHDDATWTTGNYVTVVSDWQSLAGKMASGINADRGGAWAPSSKIIFTNGNLLIAAHALVAYGGSIVGNAGSSFRLSGPNEWPLYAEGHPFRSRTILQSMLFAQHDSPEMWMPYGASIASVALVVQDANGGQYRPATLSLPLRVHAGATLARATLTFRVLAERNKAPLVLPRYRIIRVDKYGEVEPLQSIASGADANGWISPPAASKTSGSAWYAAGASQSLVATCDQNNVIDIEDYTYWAEVEEEQGPTKIVSKFEIDGVVVRERKLDVATASVGPKDPELTDGVTLDPGLEVEDRFLVMHGFQQDAGGGLIEIDYGFWTNGIWIRNEIGDQLVRPEDFDTADDVTPNFFVVTTQGTLQRRRMFEIRPPYPAVVATGFSLIVGPATGGGANPIYFGPLRPTGNAYSTVLLEFENITDMRFQ